MAGQVKVNQVQLGDSANATQNFVWQTNVDGSCKLARGNVGATTQDILTVDSVGRIQYGLLPASVRLNTSNGYGSTNTVIKRYTNVVLNQGADITYTDSPTLGASFAINKSGVYSMAIFGTSTSAFNLGISVNSLQLTTSVETIAADNKLAETAGSNTTSSTSWCGYLVAGDIVRPHASAYSPIAAREGFTITRVS